MKLAGFLLLLSGWIIALTALAILPETGTRAAFLIAGLGVEIVGLVLVFRAHTQYTEERG
jgi:ABC-type transport system involved in cytochrome bd biosynthesis fused ATPase/permease subunit